MSDFFILTEESDRFDRVRKFSDKYNRPNCSTFNRQFFNWQYNQYHTNTKKIDDNGFYVIEKDGAVASYCSSSNNKFIVNGKLVPGRFIQEWFSSPDYSGLGLSLLFRQLEKSSIVFVMGASAQNLSIMFRLRKSVWFELTRLICVYDETSTAKFANLIGAAGKNILQSIKYAPNKLVDKLSYELKDIGIYDKKYDLFWRMASEQYSFCQTRDADFMNWRYVNHPFFDYKKWVILKGDREVVHIVWRKELEPASEIYIGRIMEVIGIHAEIKKAIPYFLTCLETEKVAFVDFFCSNSSLVENMVKGGFIRNVTIPELDIPRLFSPLQVDFRKTINVAVSMADDVYNEDLADCSGFYITKGDGNQDRPNP